MHGKKAREGFEQCRFFSLLQRIASIAKEAVGTLHELGGTVMANAVAQRNVGFGKVDTQIDFGFVALAD